MMPQPSRAGSDGARRPRCTGAFACLVLAAAFIGTLPQGALGEPRVTASAEVVFEDPAVHIDASSNHVCVVTDRGNVHCWGETLLGNTDSYEGGDAVQVALGQTFTCALLAAGTVHCWGDSRWGQTSGYPFGGVLQVDATYQHACALVSTGNVFCWGQNGDGRADSYLGGDAIHVETLLYHTCVLREDQSVHCWGKNDPQQLHRHVLLGYTGGDAVQLSGGSTDACVLTESGEVHCWGTRHGTGELIFSDEDIVELVRGWHHGCVRRTGDESKAGLVEQLECWGSNNFGESEDATLFLPRQIEANYHVTCFVSHSGSAECWGREDGDYVPGLHIRATACVAPEPAFLPSCHEVNSEMP